METLLDIVQIDRYKQQPSQNRIVSVWQRNKTDSKRQTDERNSVQDDTEINQHIHY